MNHLTNAYVWRKLLTGGGLISYEVVTGKLRLEHVRMFEIEWRMKKADHLRKARRQDREQVVFDRN